MKQCSSCGGVWEPVCTYGRDTPKSQDARMKFSPTDCSKHPYPSHAEQYRKYHGKAAWLYNPWTGTMRTPEDIGTDSFGLLITGE